MPRPASDIEDRLINAARQRFLMQGVDGASLRGIAHDAGTSIGMVYYYFKTKDDLFLAVIEGAYQSILHDLRQVLDADSAPEERLQLLYQRLARLDEREFEVLRLIMREALISSARLSKLARRFQQGHVPLVLDTLREGIERGAIDAGLPLPLLLVSAIALGMLPQVAHRLVTEAKLPFAARLPSREQTAKLAGRVLLHGIGGPALRKP